jgi:hypothetical protein
MNSNGRPGFAAYRARARRIVREEENGRRYPIETFTVE